MLVTKTYLLMTGAYGAELEEKFFTDAEKTNFKDALKYVTRLVWNGENIASASPSLFVLFLTCSESSFGFCTCSCNCSSSFSLPFPSPSPSPAQHYSPQSTT
jgi:hypothetical protein